MTLHEILFPEFSNSNNIIPLFRQWVMYSRPVKISEEISTEFSSPSVGFMEKFTKELENSAENSPLNYFVPQPHICEIWEWTENGNIPRKVMEIPLEFSVPSSSTFFASMVF